MKIFTKNSLVIVLALALVLSLTGPTPMFAATSPSLGLTSTYAIVASTYTNSLNAGLETAITGDICYTTGPGTAPVSISGATVVPCDPARGTDQSTALADINSQGGCTNLGINVVLSGTYTPGCYTSSGTMDIVLSTTVTLSGAGTYIFRSGGAFTTGSNSVVALAAGASACNVFWAAVGDMVIGANSSTSATPTFVGNIIQNSLNPFNVTLGHFVNLLGRVLAFGRTVTTDSNTIAVPTGCAAAPSGGSQPATINVVKTVINDSGGTKVAADFSLFVNGTPVVSGVTNNFPAPALVYTVTESADPNYTRTFSGDCDVNGQLNLIPGDNKFCIVTNNDIGPATPVVPPLIDVLKVPNPLALPSGPGPVTYTYTLRNIGTVPVTDITMVGDTCSPIVRVSGDLNGDNKLDVNETWVYTCTTTLSATHTNIITATGWANGISAVDIASATVVVGAPIVPPLIHLVKRPSVFTLPAPGGGVLYTYTVTNPGAAALSGVSITDDKCTGLPGQVVGHPGDLNHNNLLETNETWNFTCQTNLTQTTTNTGTVVGFANGLVATDFAIATVVVAAPGFPNAGLPPDTTWNIAILAGALILILTSFAVVIRKRLI